MSLCILLPIICALLGGLTGWFLKDFFDRQKIEEKESIIRETNQQYLLLSDKLDQNNKSHEHEIQKLMDENQQLRLSNYEQNIKIENLEEKYTEAEKTLQSSHSEPLISSTSPIQLVESLSVTDDFDEDIESTEEESEIIISPITSLERTNEENDSYEPSDIIDPLYVTDEEISEYEHLIQTLENKNEKLSQQLKKKKSKYKKLRSKYNKLVITYNKQLDIVKSLRKAKEPVQIIKEIPIEITKEVEVKESIDFKKLKKILGDKLPTITSKKLKNKTKKKGKAKIKRIDPDQE